MTKRETHDAIQLSLGDYFPLQERFAFSLTTDSRNETEFNSEFPCRTECWLELRSYLTTETCSRSQPSLRRQDMRF